MIAYMLLIYVGVKIVAPWWYFLLIFLGATIKMFAACIRAAAES